LRSIQVRHVDVFTEKAFSGNPLTVIPNAVGLSDSEMQAIAAEFGTPETSFILPAKGDADYGLRIFSPIKEIQFAGHPVLGAAHVFVSESNKE
jgi:trans-2,3-dihydro-3-hydroxyanthranilate isomerase